MSWHYKTISINWPIQRKRWNVGNHSILRLDTHCSLTYLCAVIINDKDYGKRKSKLPGGI